MSRRHVKPKPAVKHSTKEKAHLRAIKRRLGPSAMRRRFRRKELQPCICVPDEDMNLPTNPACRRHGSK